MMRMARPAHPGQFIKMEVIEPLGLSVTQAAKVLGVSRADIMKALPECAPGFEKRSPHHLTQAELDCIARVLKKKS